MRDCYVKSEKLGHFCKHGEKLTFLNAHIKLKKNKIPKIPKSSNKCNDKTIVTLDMIQSLVKDKTDDEDDAFVGATSDVLNLMFNKSLEQTINKFTEPKCSERRLSPFQIQDEDPEEVKVYTYDRIAECSSSIIISDVVSLNSKEINNVSEDLAPRNILKRKLHDSNNDISNSKTVKTGVADPSKQQLDIPQFFREIGEYITTRFPLKKQMELRLEVLSLVTKAELELLHGEGV